MIYIYIYIHIYIYIYIHIYTCIYINGGRNETQTLMLDEIGVTVQSWFGVQVELMV